MKGSIKPGELIKRKPNIRIVPVLAAAIAVSLLLTVPGIYAKNNTGIKVFAGFADQDDTLEGFDKDDWKYILVNKQHPIPEDLTVELGSIHNGLKVDKRVAGPLDEMLEAAKEDGIKLLVISPYRSPEKQEKLFEKKIGRMMRQGESFLEAYGETAQAVTIPGSSEHEIGMAVDITTKEHITLDEAYADSEGGRWLKEHCHEYGFILRYPEGKEDVTGIEFEPWHYRYVGKEAAGYIMDNGLTLEEFVSMLK